MRGGAGQEERVQSEREEEKAEAVACASQGLLSGVGRHSGVASISVVSVHGKSPRVFWSFTGSLPGVESLLCQVPAS